MQHFKDLDLQQLWLDTMGWTQKSQATRQFDDSIESDFWVKLAPRYTAEYNINKDTSRVAAKLADLLGNENKILEIGCGSGNFTMLMAEYSKSILGLDFSAAMLQELQTRIQAAGCNNITTHVGKWEDFEPQSEFDYVVSVNSLYRIRDMQQALLKMHQYTRKGFIIVRTIQCPLFYPLYIANNVPCSECLDYRLIPLLLWQQGIHANVEFVNYSRSRTYRTLDEVKQEMLNDLGTEVFAQYGRMLLEKFTAQALPDDLGHTITMPRTTVFIHHKK